MVASTRKIGTDEVSNTLPSPYPTMIVLGSDPGFSQCVSEVDVKVLQVLQRFVGVRVFLVPRRIFGQDFVSPFVEAPINEHKHYHRDHGEGNKAQDDRVAFYVSRAIYIDVRAHDG